MTAHLQCQSSDRPTRTTTSVAANSPVGAREPDQPRQALQGIAYSTDGAAARRRSTLGGHVSGSPPAHAPCSLAGSLGRSLAGVPGAPAPYALPVRDRRVRRTAAGGGERQRQAIDEKARRCPGAADRCSLRGRVKYSPLSVKSSRLPPPPFWCVCHGRHLEGGRGPVNLYCRSCATYGTVLWRCGAPSVREARRGRWGYYLQRPGGVSGSTWPSSCPATCPVATRAHVRRDAGTPAPPGVAPTLGEGGERSTPVAAVAGGRGEGGRLRRRRSPACGGRRHGHPCGLLRAGGYGRLWRRWQVRCCDSMLLVPGVGRVPIVLTCERARGRPGGGLVAWVRGMLLVMVIGVFPFRRRHCSRRWSACDTREQSGGGRCCADGSEAGMLSWTLGREG